MAEELEKQTEEVWQWSPWSPIRTAPKDGTRFLGVSKGCRPHVYYWRSGDYNNWCIDYVDGAVWPPTHWMPLPAGLEAHP